MCIMICAYAWTWTHIPLALRQSKSSMSLHIYKRTHKTYTNFNYNMCLFVRLPCSSIPPMVKMNYDLGSNGHVPLYSFQWNKNLTVSIPPSPPLPFPLHPPFLCVHLPPFDSFHPFRDAEYLHSQDADWVFHISESISRGSNFSSNDQCNAQTAISEMMS